MLSRHWLFAWVLALGAVSTAFSANIPLQSRVSGVVQFERHQAFSPLGVCSVEPCTKPLPFWRVVIASQDHKVVLDHVYGVGSAQQPEAVEIAGVLVKEGAVVSLEGDLESSDPSFVLLGNISRVDVDRHSAPVYGWNCSNSTLTAQKAGRIYLTVWMDEMSTPQPSYKLQIMANREDKVDEFYPVAKVDHVTLDARPSELIYQGSSTTASVLLDIERKVDSITRLPSRLHLTRIQKFLDDGFSVDLDLAITCTQLRRH